MSNEQRLTAPLTAVFVIAIVLTTPFAVPAGHAQQTEQPVTNHDPRYFVYMRGIT